MCDGSYDSIHWLTRNCGNVGNSVQTGPLRAEKTGWEREPVDLRMMQYTAYAVLRINPRSCNREIVNNNLTLCS